MCGKVHYYLEMIFHLYDKYKMKIELINSMKTNVDSSNIKLNTNDIIPAPTTGCLFSVEETEYPRKEKYQ